MISDFLVRAFGNAAKALASGAKDTGFTSNGLRKLDFVIKEPNPDNPKEVRPRVFTAIQQNPNKLSVPGKLAREGHVVIQIRDNDAGALVGNVDVTEKRFNSYENIPQPVDMSDIEQALGSEAVLADEGSGLAVTAARTAIPVDMTPTDSPVNAEAGRVEAPQGPDFQNRPGRASFDIGDPGKKAA